MTSQKHFDDLPNEVVLKIFTFLSIEDLAVSVQHVCARWRDISLDNKLWKNSIYTPRRKMSDKEIARHLRNMPSLKCYSASRGTRNCVLNTLCHSCPEITSIELHRFHSVKASLLQKIVEQYPRLEYLKLSYPDRKAIIFSGIIGKCKFLVTLKITGFYEYTLQIYEGILTPIADGCPSLKHIFLEHYSSICEDIQYFLRKKKQHLLSFSCQLYLTKEIAECMSECTQLQLLSIENYNKSLMFDNIKPLMKLTNLKSFSLHPCYADVSHNLHAFFYNGSFSQLTHLDISENCSIDDRTLEVILNICRQLRHLNISGSYVHSETLCCIGSCGLLEYLDLSRCKYLEDDTIKHIVAGCPNLRYLDTSFSSTITDRVIEYVVQCKELRVLKLNINDSFSGSSLHNVPMHLYRLTELHLERCCILEDKYIDRLRREMPFLKIVLTPDQN